MIAAFALALAAQDAQEPIVITGRGLDESADIPPSAIVFDGTDPQSVASGRSEGLLTLMPNLSLFRRSDSRSVHPTSQGITARGLGGNAASRLTLSVDGVPQADPFGGWLNLAALDPASIDQFDISYGPVVEPGAVAGAIRIDTIFEEDFTARAAVGGEGRVDGSLVAGTALGKGFVQLSAGYLRGDGFIPVVAEDRGPADRAARTDQASARVRIVQPVAGIEAQASLAWFDDQRDRGYDRSDNRAKGLDLALRLVEREGALPFELVGWWQDRQFDTRFAALDDERASTRIVLDQYDVPATGYGAEGRVRWGDEGVGGHVGAGWRGSEARVAERFFFVDDAPTRERRAGGDSRIASLMSGLDLGSTVTRFTLDGRLDFWRLADGFRTIEQLADGASLEDSTFDERDGTQWSARAAIEHDIDRVTLTLAAARGWRLPTLNELYRPFRVGADATAANEALRPETSYGVDGWIHWNGPIRIKANIFAQRLDQAIANLPLGAGPGQFPGVGFVARGGTYAQRRNLEAITSRGITFDAAWYDERFDVRLLYGYADARLVTSGDAAAFDGNRPAQSPVHSGSLSLGWRDGERRVGLTARLDGKRHNDLANLEELDAAISVDATARWPVAKGFALEVRGENLTDAEILSDIQSDGARERARGRTFWIGVVID
ncbi:TonB-dependent receptor [Sphingomicrobium flavum]|uniref:TonB-dependent receptor n=1 Tax=Sphingomicrobium flavum TaxID=1229164 RepID=UPI0021ADA58B|nr:TonB-dependent receptor [Sphingomicrobium flavum]